MIYASHLLEDIQMQEIVKETNMGIESIEFSISENLDHLVPKLRKYEKRLEKMNCNNLILHGPFLDLNPIAFDFLIVEATRKRYEAVYEAAKYLHAQKIVLHTCYIPSIYFLTGWAERMSQFFKRFLEGKEGIQFVLENVYDQKPEPILEVIQKVDHPDFRLCLDIGHANCYSNIPVMEWVKCFGSNIGHLHVHDNQGKKDSHGGIGSGNIPMKEVLTQVRNNNPELTCTIECSEKEELWRSYSMMHEWNML